MSGDSPLKPKRLVVGTHNKGKVREILELLDDLPLEVVSLDAFDSIEDVEETGDTFEANAAQKAMGFAAQTGELVMADDSGLIVDALDGRPGVFSARYGGPGLSDADRYLRLLEELADTPDEARTARFQCAIAMADGGQTPIAAAGAVEGRIARAPSGEEGFGYDPVFVPDGFDTTFAKLGLDVKQRISHRARALAVFKEKLEAWLAQE